MRNLQFTVFCFCFQSFIHLSIPRVGNTGDGFIPYHTETMRLKWLGCKLLAFYQNCLSDFLTIGWYDYSYNISYHIISYHIIHTYIWIFDATVQKMQWHWWHQTVSWHWLDSQVIWLHFRPMLPMFLAMHLRSKDYGSPNSRERCYLIGVRKGVCSPKQLEGVCVFVQHFCSDVHQRSTLNDCTLSEWPMRVPWQFEKSMALLTVTFLWYWIYSYALSFDLGVSHLVAFWI